MGCDSSKQKGDMQMKIYTGEHYELEGKVDEDAKAQYDGMMMGLGMVTDQMWTEDFIKTAMRANASGVLAMFETPEYKKFNNLAETEEVAAIGGPDFHPQAMCQTAIIHRVKGQPKESRPCLVYSMVVEATRVPLSTTSP